MSPSHLALPLPLRRLKRLPLALFMAGCATGSMAYAADQAPANDATPAANTAPTKADASQLQTVTVTARRREESAQNVPTPMSVLSGQTLETQRVYRIQDLQQLVPSVNVAYMHARFAGWATTRPATAWKAASVCISTTSTSGVLAWPCST